MYLNCINKNNTQVLSNLSELSALIGRENAEWLLMYNNGNSLDYLPNGTVNNEFTKLLDKYDGNRALALKDRADELLNYTKEMRDIANQAITNGTFMKAPNGNPTNLNERQWLQVRTKAFKKWFGDWESAAARIVNAKVIWGHPGIGKTEYYKNNNNNVIDFDSVYKPRINKELGLPAGAEERKKWRREHRDEYTQKILDLFDEAVEDAKKQGKQLLVSDMVVLQERESALDIITQMSEDTFAKRSEQRNEPYDDNKKLWKTDIDESIAKVSDKFKIVNTEKYLSELYEDSKNVSKVIDENGEPLVVYHGSDSKFTEFRNDVPIYTSNNIELTTTYVEDKFFDDSLNDNYTEFDALKDIRYIAEELEFVGYADEQHPVGKKLSDFIKTHRDLFNDWSGSYIYENSAITIKNKYFNEFKKALYLDKLEKNNYKLFNNVKNPLIIDAKYQAWNKISFEDGIVSTRQLEQIARDRGYDGFIVKNVIDLGESSSDEQRFNGVNGTIFVAFNPHQIKSATDNNSEFSKANNDIRYNSEITGLFDLLDYIAKTEKLTITYDNGEQVNYELISKFKNTYYLPKKFSDTNKLKQRIASYLAENDLPKDLIQFNEDYKGNVIASIDETKLKDKIERNNLNAELGNLFETPEETKNVTTVLNKLSSITGLKYKTISESDAVELLKKEFKSKKVDLSNTNAFVYNDTCYFIQGRRLNTDIAAEEMLHPFIAAIRKYNQEAYLSLLKDARKAFPKLRLEIAHTYKSNKGDELITQALSRAFRQDIKDNSEGHKLKDLIQNFINYVRDVFKSVFGENSRILSYFTNIDNILQNKEIKAEDLSKNITIDELAKVINSDVERIESDTNIFRQNLKNNRESNSNPTESTLANTIDTIQNEKQAKTLKELAPELYEKAVSIQALNNLPGMTPAIINDVAKYFTEQLISVVEAIIEGDENNFTYSYLLESFPNTFTKEVLSELIEIRKLPNQIDKYRSTFKLINTKLLFDVVLADIDTYAADTFPEMRSLWIDDGVKQVFRIAYIDYINKFLFDYFGFRISTKLSKTGKTEYGIDKAFDQKQENTHDTAEDDYLDEMENSGEQEREFDFLTSNLNKLLSDTIDLKVKNLITRIPQPDKFDRFGLPIYYPRAYVMNTIAQLFSKCLTFEDMLDEIKNIDNEIMPFKDDIIDMMLDEKNRTLFYRSFQKAKQNYWKIINNKHNQFIDSKLDSNSKKDVIEEQIINAAEKAGTENAKSSMYVYTDENKISSTIKFNVEKVKKLRNDVAALAKKYDFKLKNNSYYKVGKLNTNTDASTYQALINEISGLFSDMNLWKINEYELKQLFRPDKNGDVKWNSFAELLDNILKYANYKKNPLSSESLGKFENLKSFISDKLYGITEAVEYDNGKPYATITYTHYLKQLEKRIKKARVNAELYNKFIQEEYLKFRYFGKYYNEPWFKSWIKDGLDLFDVKTLTTFNGKQYDKMVKDTDHFEFGFINFIKAFNKHTNYVLPVLSDKTTNGMIVGSVFEKGEIVDRLFSVFMQELDRIKQVYHRACIRYSDPSVIRIKNWDTGPLMKEGSTLKLQFNHKIGGGEFKLMSMINPVLYKINDENLDKNSFEYKLQQYIYNEDSLEIKDLMDKDSTFFSSLYNDFYKYCDSKLEEMSTEFADDFISKDGKYYDYFKKHFPANKVLSTVRDLKIEGDSEKEKITNLIKLFFINNFYAKTQIYQLLVGDIAVYDGWNDAQKRIAGCISPSLRYDLGAKSPINSDTKTDSNYSTTGNKRALVISDTEGMSNQYNVIKKIFERRLKIASDNFAKAHKKKLNELSKDEQKQLQEELGRINAEFKLFSETNGTDGQGFLSLEGLRKHLGMLGYAPGFLDDFIKDVRKMLYITNRDQQRIAWEKIKEDYPNALFEIEKQFTFSPTPYTDSCDDNSVVKLCTMVKNAEMPILDFDEMLYRNDKNPSNNPLLLTLLKFMDSHDIDVIYTKSNIKSGLKGVVDLSKCKTVKDVRGALEKAISDENINEYVIEIPYQNIGEQQPGIKHYTDSDIILGAQVKKLMPSFIKRCFNKKSVKINDKDYTGEDLLKLFEKVIAGLNRKGFYDLKRYFKLPKGVMDKLTAGIDLTDEEAFKARIGFCKFVQEELEKDPQVDSEIINDLSLTPSGEWKLPLEDMSGMLKLQKIFTKLVKTTAVKNKIDGGYLVQATDAMRLNIINDENPDNKDATGNKNLKIIFYDKLKNGTVIETAFPKNPIGIAYLEARLPYFYKKFYSRYKDSSKIPDNLRKLICYRTPTEGACSIFPVKVVGFSPKASGGKIQLPMDITSIAGVDFDIDKLFFTAPAMDKDGNYVNYNLDKDISTMSKKELENLLLDIMWKVCTSENYMYEMFSPSNFILLKRLANIFKAFNSEDETERTSDFLRELFGCSDEGLSAIAKAIDNNAQLCDFRTEMYIHQRNARSAGEIGPFAINNVIHSLLEGLGITVDNVFTSVNFCGVQLSNSTIVDPMYDNNGNLTTRNNQMFLAAAVDGSKSPVLDDLGLTPEAINVITVMTRLGISVPDCILFIQQPIIRNFLDTFAEKMDAWEFDPKSGTKRPSMSDALKEYIDDINVLFKGKLPLSTSVITHDSLIDGTVVDLSTGEAEEWAKQTPLLGVLNGFIKCNELFLRAQKILRADSVTGTNDLKTLFDFMIFLSNTEKMTTYRPTKKPTFSKKFAALFNTKSDAALYNIADQRDQLKETINLILSVSAPLVRQFYEESSMHIFSETDKEFTGEDLMQMYCEFIWFVMLNSSENRVFNNSYDFLSYFATDARTDITKLQKELSSDPEFSENLIVKHLYYNKFTEVLSIKSLGMSSDVRKQVSQDWLKLLSSDNKAAKDFGEILLNYSFYTTAGSQLKGNLNSFITSDIKLMIPNYKNALKNLSISKISFSIFSELYFRNHKEKVTDLSDIADDITFISEPLIGKSGSKLKTEEGDDVYESILITPDNKKKELPKFGTLNGLLYKSSADDPLIYELIEPLGGAISEYSVYNLENGSVIDSNKIGYLDPDTKMSDTLSLEELRESQEIETSNTETVEQESDIDDSDLIFTDENADDNLFLEEIPEDVKKEAAKKIKDENPCTNTL